MEKNFETNKAEWKQQHFPLQNPYPKLQSHHAWELSQNNAKRYKQEQEKEQQDDNKTKKTL